MASLTSRTTRVFAFASLGLLTLLGTARGQTMSPRLAAAGSASVPGTCQPSWLPTFGQEPGTSKSVQSLASFNDGSGPALYAGGMFNQAGGVTASAIAKWDGSTWSPVGDGLGGGISTMVTCLTVFDDGSGPALYAGGSFSGGGTGYLSRWNGTTWSAVGGGVSGVVTALGVYDDGTGPALYVGGTFTKAGGVPADHIAKWDGSHWSALGSGTDRPPYALTVFDVGAGPVLCAGGQFETAGGAPAMHVATWDGSTWSALGAGVGEALTDPSKPSDMVFALAVFDDGSGPALVAGGRFTTAGGVPCKHVARWNGTAWAELGGGTDGYQVRALLPADIGDGSRLYVSGAFLQAGGVPATGIAAWDGSAWAPLGAGAGGPEALATFDDGTGPALFAGGNFKTAGGAPALYIAKWKDSSWSTLGSGVSRYVRALEVFDDGSGAALYAGGQLTIAGGLPVNGLARWDGSTWTQVGSTTDSLVEALEAFDDGSGAVLCAASSSSDCRVTAWDGVSWTLLGDTQGDPIHCLATFNDGSGYALYAGGQFTTIDGVAANGIARWDGSTWAPLGSVTSQFADVHALAVFDDGSGPALYAGGGIVSLGGVPAKNVARWDGSSWSPLGAGVDWTVDALTVFDDGSGPALIVGGGFHEAGGLPASAIAKWDGSSWSPLGGGLGQPELGGVSALTVFDDGSGPALYAGGTFQHAGGIPASCIAKWDGSQWSALGNGTSSTVLALMPFDDGTGPALFAGGFFGTVPDSSDSYIAKWGGCSVSAWTDLGFALPGAAGAPELTGSGSLLPGAPILLSLTHAAPSAPAILLLSTSSAPFPFKGGTLLPVPPLAALPYATSPTGDVLLAFASWPAGASALSFTFQYAIHDAGAVQRVALSNALRADVP